MCKDSLKGQLIGRTTSALRVQFLIVFAIAFVLLLVLIIFSEGQHAGHKAIIDAAMRIASLYLPILAAYIGVLPSIVQEPSKQKNLSIEVALICWTLVIATQGFGILYFVNNVFLHDYDNPNGSKTFSEGVSGFMQLMLMMWPVSVGAIEFLLNRKIH